MASSFEQSEVWREMARDARKVAEAIEDDKTRQFALQVADEYERIAEQFEQRDSTKH